MYSMIKNIIDGKDIVISFEDYIRLTTIEGLFKGFLNGIVSAYDVPDYIKDGSKKIIQQYYEK